MRVSFSLLTDSQDDGASPWHVVAIVLEVVGAIDRLMLYVAVGGSKLDPFGRSAADEVLVFAQNSAIRMSWCTVLVLIDRRS